MSKAIIAFHVVAALIIGTTSAVSMAADKEAAKSATVVLTQSIHLKVTVVDVKKKEREITVRDDKGAEMVLVASDKVRNFNQIAKGDTIEVEYKRAAASALEKVSDTNAAGQAASVERAAAGDKPGLKAQQVTTIVATVLEVDAKERLLTVQGPKGNIVTIEVPVEVKAFDSLKKGDKISAAYAEAIAISVKSPSKKK